MSARLGVLLMTYGSPSDDLHDLPQYLAAVRGGREPSDELVTEFRRRYEAISGSPLIGITRDQAAAVEARLRAIGVDAAATVGMRFSRPTILDALRELAEAGCQWVSAIVMSPQYSELLMAGYRRALDAASEELGAAAPAVEIAPAWYRQPDFIGAVADRIREALDGPSRDVPVLLTAHSLPRRVAEAEPGYLRQLRETAELVAADAGLAPDRWHFCWQSAGHEPGEWMKPDISDLLPEIRDAGHRAVLVAPVQFLADHLEVLYDIDIAARRQAEDAGLIFRRIESLNVTPRFIAALTDVARGPATAGSVDDPVKPPNYVANFDSASAMMRATARFLAGRDFPTLGVKSPIEPLTPVIRLLPDWALAQLYIWSGASEAAPAERIGDVRAERLSEWVVSEYPQRQYPAVFIGSSNGALVHLACALGAPFLPQTFLIPVRRSGVDPDEPGADLAWGREPGRRLLAANPELQLHHMHDANQDRLMIQRMTYFRVKRRTLGAAYSRLLEERLRPGGVIFVVECERRWPVTTVAPRHYFQPGAMGGLEPEDYLHGSPRVAEYLARYGSERRRWDEPAPDDMQPEAEWGFEPAILADLQELAAHRGYRLRRIVFRDPEDFSPFVADLYRWWYARRGIAARRLVSASFIVMEPYWTARTASVPWWAKFGVEPSAERLERYVEQAGPFDEIGIMLFSHGIKGAGFAPIERWRAILRRATRRGFFIGVDESRYPLDFATFKRYHQAMKQLRPRNPIPDRLELDELDGFLDEAGDRYPVRWTDAIPAGELA